MENTVLLSQVNRDRLDWQSGTQIAHRNRPKGFTWGIETGKAWGVIVNGIDGSLEVARAFVDYQGERKYTGIRLYHSPVLTGIPGVTIEDRDAGRSAMWREAGSALEMLRLAADLEEK